MFLNFQHDTKERETRSVVEKFTALKTAAKAGGVDPKEMEKHCLLGAEWRRVITTPTVSALPGHQMMPTWCAFDRTVEAVFVLGCLVSDEKSLPLAKQRIGELIDALDPYMMRDGSRNSFALQVEELVGGLSRDGYALYDMRARLIAIVKLTRAMQFGLTSRNDEGLIGLHQEIINGVNNVLTPFLSYTENLMACEKLKPPLLGD